MNEQTRNVGMDALGSLYREIVLEHAKEPQNFGTLSQADSSAEGYNPMCGDRVCVQVRLDPSRTRVEEVGFTGEGCSICMASSSMMTEEVQKQPIVDTERLIQNFRDVLTGTQDPSILDGDIASLAGVRNFAVRVKCASLPWTTLKEALESALSGKNQEKRS